MNHAPNIRAQMIVGSHLLPHEWSWSRRITLAVLVGVLAALLSHLQVFWKQDDALYDRWVGQWHYTPDPRLLIIAIDASSVNALGPLPWPRSTHAQLLDRLTDAGSTRVAMDLLLSEPTADDASQDAELAASIRRNGHVVLPVVAVPTRRPGIAEELLAFFKFFIVIANFGNHHVDLVPCINLFASACPQAICPGRFFRKRHHMGCGLLPSGGQLIEYGNIKVTKHGHGDGTGNGGCRHHQTMRQLAVVPTQRVTLFHTETVLLIDYGKP